MAEGRAVARLFRTASRSRLSGKGAFPRRAETQRLSAFFSEFSRSLVNIGGPHAEVLTEGLVWTNFWLTVWVRRAGSMASRLNDFCGVEGV